VNSGIEQQLKAKIKEVGWRKDRSRDRGDWEIGMQAVMEATIGGLGLLGGVQLSGSNVECQLQTGRACCQLAPCSSVDSVSLFSLSHKAAAIRRRQEAKDRGRVTTVLAQGGGSSSMLSLGVAAVRSRAGVVEPPRGTLAESSIPVRIVLHLLANLLYCIFFMSLNLLQICIMLSRIWFSWTL
jgi:hypothetical protein